MNWSDDWYWLAFGLVGQVAFFARFLIQWVVSERRRESVIPVSFWYLSLVGSLILLVYAIHRKEPVFLLAYLPNAVVYWRNLALVKRRERMLREEEKPGPPPVRPAAAPTRPDL